jgi:mRNA-degrading endonuclease RelE of RelBE toxin-antitoxin system
VISRGLPEFWRRYRALPAEVRAQAREAYRIFAVDPGHCSLRFKKLAGYDDVWSARIGRKYRVVGKRDGDTITRGWIGSHNDFDKLF